jgi:predicted hydrocarbon binding protein
MAGMWGAIFFEGSNLVFSHPKTSEEEQMAQKAKFVHDWILNMMENMDQQMGEEEKIRLLESCGRACATRHAQKEAMKSQGNLDAWLTTMKKWVGANNVKKEANTVRVIYSKCLCPLVQDGPPLMSNTYCNCSRGWLKEVFETVLEKPVEVKLEDSIMKGGQQCRFTINW